MDFPKYLLDMVPKDGKRHDVSYRNSCGNVTVWIDSKRVKPQESWPDMEFIGSYSGFDVSFVSDLGSEIPPDPIAHPASSLK